MTSEEYWIKNKTKLQLNERSYNAFEMGVKFCENNITDIKANCDLAIEGRDIKIKELEEENNKFLDVISNYEVKIADLEKQIEKMKCCGNCRFGYCERSSEYIGKDGNRTFHCWNEEKEKYCDVGKNGKYQCWEIKE